MQIHKFAPCFVVDDVPGTARFYVEHFGFAPTSDVGWFVSLAHGDAAYELSFLQRGHTFLPPSARDASVSGVVLGFIVADATAEAERLRAAGLAFVTELVDEPYGQRHFLVRDPNGVILDVIEQIPPDPAWMAQFSSM